METACRSREAGTFDGCPRCWAAALVATERAALYVVRRTALGRSRSLAPALHDSTLRLRILDDDGRVLAAAETANGESSHDATDGAPADPDDFQTAIDELDMGPSPGGGIRGRIAGRLHGYGRAIGRFEVDVAPSGTVVEASSQPLVRIRTGH